MNDTTNQGEQKQDDRPPIQDEGERQRLLSSAHLSGEPKAYETHGGERIQLRTFSLMTMELCELMGLSMMMEGPDGLDNNEIIEQVAAFAWAQSAPVEDVFQHVDGGTWKPQVRLFKARLDIPVITLLLEDVGKLAKQAAASAFALKKKVEAKD